MHALQIFRYQSGNIPEDLHVPEMIPAPEEVFSLASIRCDDKTEKTAIEGIEVHVGEGKVLAAQIIDIGRLCKDHGPVVAIV